MNTLDRLSAHGKTEIHATIRLHGQDGLTTTIILFVDPNIEVGDLWAFADRRIRESGVQHFDVEVIAMRGTRPETAVERIQRRFRQIMPNVPYCGRA